VNVVRGFADPSITRAAREIGVAASASAARSRRRRARSRRRAADAPALQFVTRMATLKELQAAFV
jgi:hypothetical protein